MIVLIIGAHPDPSRFAHKALNLLGVHGHESACINPKFKTVDNKPCYGSIQEWQKKSGQTADTLTMYVGPAVSTKMQAEIIEHKPRRVIFNPGSENPALADALENAGIECVNDCTLVMLGSQNF